ncbi:MAG TPA: hypothetical protein VH374_23710 [Polyangia bacterium]|jgi:hypothetical protein|nr:hypothetical protein [Polyangia bacterium]
MADDVLTASAFDFNANASCGEDGMNVKMVGTADMAVRPVLDDFFARIHASAVSHHVRETILDLRGLAFMSSSCLMGVAFWISKIQELPTLDRYQLILVSNPEVPWQRRSFNALSRLASDLVSVRL